MEHAFPQHIYHLKSRKTNLVLAVLEFVAAIFLFIAGQSIFGFILLINCIAMYGLTTPRFIVSPSGISYHDINLAIHSNWENIDRVGFIDFRVFGLRRCILLKKESKINWWMALSWSVSNDKRGKIIPILDDNRWEKFDELKEKIKSHIPDITGLD